MNAVIGAGSAPSDDWLLVCLASDATTLAILRGDQLMFYRHRDDGRRRAAERARASDGDVPRGSARRDEVRARLAVPARRSRAATRRSPGARLRDRLNVPAEAVDVRPAAGLPSQVQPLPDVLDALAAPVGVLLRERRAA